MSIFIIDFIICIWFFITLFELITYIFMDLCSYKSYLHHFHRHSIDDYRISFDNFMDACDTIIVL